MDDVDEIRDQDAEPERQADDIAHDDDEGHREGDQEAVREVDGRVDPTRVHGPPLPDPRPGVKPSACLPATREYMRVSQQ